MGMACHPGGGEFWTTCGHAVQGRDVSPTSGGPRWTWLEEANPTPDDAAGACGLIMAPAALRTGSATPDPAFGWAERVLATLVPTDAAELSWECWSGPVSIRPDCAVAPPGIRRVMTQGYGMPPSR